MPLIHCLIAVFGYSNIERVWNRVPKLSNATHYNFIIKAWVYDWRCGKTLNRWRKLLRLPRPEASLKSHHAGDTALELRLRPLSPTVLGLKLTLMTQVIDLYGWRNITSLTASGFQQCVTEVSSHHITTYICSFRIRREKDRRLRKRVESDRRALRRGHRGVFSTTRQPPEKASRSAGGASCLWSYATSDSQGRPFFQSLAHFLFHNKVPYLKDAKWDPITMPTLSVRWSVCLYSVTEVDIYWHP